MIKKFRFFLCLSLFFSGITLGTDLGVQALSSLVYFLEEQQNEERCDDSIVFEDEDVWSLWETVLAENPDEPTLAIAFDLFIQAKSYIDHDEHAKAHPLLLFASSHLSAQWLKLTEHDHISSVASNGQDGFKKAKDFQTNPPLSSSDFKKIRPFLLPSTHAIKPALDAIFGASRATVYDETLRAAGFEIKFLQPRSYIRVVCHPLLPGFLLKLYLDSDKRKKKGIPGWKWLVNRCEGAQKIRETIAKSHVKLFLVPKKWIYALPLSPPPPTGPQFDPKPVILVVQEMNLVSYAENKVAWKTKITRKHLEELYLIISQSGGSSYRPDNIAYTQDGTFAFIDTEYPDHKPDYHSIRPYLNDGTRGYWDKLVKNGGKSIGKDISSP